ncbi:MAG: peptidase U34, partial [Candidatus Krumholzibacteria bacterium]|nr:peptidase U34 [Candidatus Krumholzibacteria bacterium]
MRRYALITLICLIAILAAPARNLLACTSILAAKGATKDGSVIITYSCDGEFHARLRSRPAADHEPGDFYEIKDWTGNVLGKIKEVPR